MEILLVKCLSPKVGNLMDEILLALENGLQTILEFLGILVGLLESLLYLHQSQGEVKYLVRLEGLCEKTHPQRIIYLIIVVCRRLQNVRYLRCRV